MKYVFEDHEDLVATILEDPDGDVVCLVAVHVGEDGDSPFAEVRGTGPRQLVAVMLRALADSFSRDLEGSQ